MSYLRKTRRRDKIQIEEESQHLISLDTIARDISKEILSSTNVFLPKLLHKSNAFIHVLHRTLTVYCSEDIIGTLR